MLVEGIPSQDANILTSLPFKTVYICSAFLVSVQTSIVTSSLLTITDRTSRVSLRSLSQSFFYCGQESLCYRHPSNLPCKHCLRAKKLTYTNRTPGSRSSLPLSMQPFSPAHGLPVQPIFLSHRGPYTDWQPADMPLRSFSRLGKTASLGFAFCSVVLSLSCHLWPLHTEKRAKCLAIVSEYLEEICARLWN